MGGEHNQATLLLQEPMDNHSADLALEAWQEETDITLWGEGQERIFTGAPGHSAQVSLIVFAGSTELLFPGNGILYDTDREGCLLDEKAAEELFGSREVEGEVISSGTSCWTVRGVLKLQEGLVVLPAGTGIDDIPISRLTARLGGLEYQAAAELLWQGGFSGSLLRLDFYENFSWVKELVPGKWADFAGWRSNLEKKRQEWRMLTNTEKYVPELVWYRECRSFQQFHGASILFLLVFLALLFYLTVYPYLGKAEFCLTFQRKGEIINKKFRR